MTNNAAKNSLQAKSNTVREVAAILSGIHGQIINLHRCSSDDFLALNADFKRYYGICKQISGNANSIFRSLSESNEDNHFAELNNIYRELKLISNRFNAKGEATLQFLKSILSLLDDLYLPIKNLGQDLMTLKLLFTNLNLTESGETTGTVQGMVVDLIRVVSTFKNKLVLNEQSIVSIRKRVNEQLECYRSKFEGSANELDTTINSIHLAILFFAEKHQEVAMEIPNLSQKIENSTNSINHIITSLQYQDIIRQKIEHIHASQKDILANIQASDWNSNPESTNSFIHQIKDVVNLHSAQLLRANKEYQHAIEGIAAEFLGIETQMSAISAMCQTISSSQKNEDDLYLDRIIGTLNNSVLTMGIMESLSQSPACETNWLAEDINSIVFEIDGTHTILAELKTLMAKLTRIASNNYENTFTQKSIAQITTLFSDIERYEHTVQKIINSLNGVSRVANGNVNAYDERESFETLYKGLNSIVGQLNGKNSTISQRLNENKHLSQNISLQVSDSIRNIKYYDFFDRVIVEIIAELTLIHRKLVTLVDDSASSNRTSLDSERNLYTMASEHQVHQQVIGNSSFVENSNSANGNSDEDNIEFF